MDRRKFLFTSAAVTAASAVSACEFGVGEPEPVTGLDVEKSVTVNGGVTTTNQPILSRLGRMLQDNYSVRLRQIEKDSLEKKDKLYYVADVLAYQIDTRAKIKECFGNFPIGIPLNSKVTGILDRTTYTIEKVLFESHPGFIVSANLYLPKSSSLVPGVIGLCGHDAGGKYHYQDFAQRLAKLGYACLIIDAIGMGERSQFKVQSSPGSEHMQVGRQLPLVDQSMAGLQAFDAYRAVDYLLTRSEIDHNHIGVMGNSGGGTQAAWLTAVDSRITMSAPSCFVTTFRRNFDNELVQDSEQLPLKALSLGLDIDDFLAVHAPKPLILVGQIFDYFNVYGLREIYARLMRIYRILGKPENLQLHIGNSVHGYNTAAHEASFKLFGQSTGIATWKAPPVTFEPETNLRCTVTGNVANEPGAVRSTGLMSTWANECALTRGHPSGQALRVAVTSALRIPVTSGQNTTSPPDSRTWPVHSITSSKYPKPWACVHAIETMGPNSNILVPLYHITQTPEVSIPATVPTGSKAILYISDKSTDQELGGIAIDPLITLLCKAEPMSAFFGCDLRGVGESSPILNGQYAADFYGNYAESLNEPMLGSAVSDIIRVIDWLGFYGYTDIHIAGRYCGSIPAALAAVLDSRVKRVTLKNNLKSWDSVAKAEPTEYNWPVWLLPSKVLNYFDLPDVYTELQTKNLTQIAPWGAWLAKG